MNFLQAGYIVEDIKRYDEFLMQRQAEKVGMTREEALACSMDEDDYPEFFSIGIGKNFKLETRPELYAVVNDPRRVKIVLTTYRGVSWNAIHYYARIEADGIDICSDFTKKDGTIGRTHCGGYICEEYSNLPRNKKTLWKSCYEIEVLRPVTQKEIDEDPQRWTGYKAGSMTNAFYTKEEAEQQARKIIYYRFSPEWQIEVEDNT